MGTCRASADGTRTRGRCVGHACGAAGHAGFAAAAKTQNRCTAVWQHACLSEEDFGVHLRVLIHLAAIRVHNLHMWLTRA